MRFPRCTLRHRRADRSIPPVLHRASSVASYQPCYERSPPYVIRCRAPAPADLSHALQNASALLVWETTMRLLGAQQLKQ